MKTLSLLVCLMLATMAAAQQESKPYGGTDVAPAQEHTGQFSESTIQGCVVGSETTGRYVLTDENTGRIYVLHGNDPLLKAQVGHEAAMTGTATPMAGKPGSAGYHEPNAPTSGATQKAGKAALNFAVTHVEMVASQCNRNTQSQKSALAASEAALGSVRSDNRSATEPQIGYAAQDQTKNVLLGCISAAGNGFILSQPQQKRTYRLQGDPAQLRNDAGKMVQVTGRIVAGTGAQQNAPSVQVNAVQVVQSSCTYQAPPGALPRKATGKTGNTGEAFPVTDTSTVGQVTPGNETQAGRAQAPGQQTGLTAGGVPQSQNQTAANGAPPTAEQTAQNPQDALKYRGAAEQSELSNPQQQLGVNAQPNYSGVQQQQQSMEQNNKTAREGETYPQGRNPQQGTALPGASQQMGQRPHRSGATEAAEHHQAEPMLVGCLTGSGHDFVLREQKTGTEYRLNASPEQLKDHVNHLVGIVGKVGDRQGGKPAVAASSQPVLRVDGVQDLAPTCGAGARR